MSFITIAFFVISWPTYWNG